MSDNSLRAGMIVDYRLDEANVAAIRNARAASLGHLGGERRGNNVKAGDVFPMLIVRVWGSSPNSSVNGQVFFDGNDNLWVMSVAPGDGNRQFTVPE